MISIIVLHSALLTVQADIIYTIHGHLDSYILEVHGHLDIILVC